MENFRRCFPQGYSHKVWKSLPRETEPKDPGSGFSVRRGPQGDGYKLFHHEGRFFNQRSNQAMIVRVQVKRLLRSRM